MAFYGLIRCVFPRFAGDNPLARGLVGAAPMLAEIAAALLVFIAVLSFLRDLGNRSIFARQTGRQSMRRLSWKQFERLVAETFRRQGFLVEENLDTGPDDGIDLVLTAGDQRFLVQCKNWRTRSVGVKVVRELLGVVTAEGADGGAVVCSGGFTAEAQRFAKGKPLQLIDGDELTRMIGTVREDDSATQIEPPEVAPRCPRCGGNMVERTARIGKHKGSQFLGCENFPRCRGTRPVP